MRLHQLAIVGAVAAWAGLAAADPQRLTVEEAVQRALLQNPSLQAAAARQSATHQAALSAGARLLPSIHLSEEYQHYKDPFLIAFQPGAPPFSVRDRDTNTFSAVADQPLLGLGHLTSDYLAQREAAAAHAAGLAAARAQLIEAVQVGYLRYFEAGAMAGVARASIQELAEQVNTAQAKVKAGVLTNADLLRVEVAQANAQQQEIAAQSQAQVARARLLAAIGLDPANADISLAEPTALLQSTGPLPEATTASATALHHRPEVVQQQKSAQSAAHTRTGRYLALLPEVDAEAGYVRIDGQAFAPPESWYLGVRASWPIWQWGASFFAARAAAKQAAAAAADLASQRNQVSTEVQSALAQSRAAQAAVTVAQKTIDSAQEAYRVTDALVKAGAATTTDLLDSQAALTTARLNLERARYELAIERVDLARVMGQ